LFAEPNVGVALAVVITVLTIGVSAGEAADDRTSVVAQAIAEAIRLRMAPTQVVVTVDSITDIRLDAGARSMTAHVSPYARAGEPTRFVLTAPGGARGETTALVHVQVEGVRARGPIQRGARVTAGDVETLRIDLHHRQIRPLPFLDEVLGATARRDIEAGATLIRSDIAPEAAVRVGREVAAHVTVGDAHVTGTLVAAQNGTRNQIVRVVNPATRQIRRARVVGVDEVEVLDAR
jgi:flagella basal body P-ring formation protein FlgA